MRLKYTEGFWPFSKSRWEIEIKGRFLSIPGGEFPIHKEYIGFPHNLFDPVNESKGYVVQGSESLYFFNGEQFTQIPGSRFLAKSTWIDSFDVNWWKKSFLLTQRGIYQLESDLTLTKTDFPYSSEIGKTKIGFFPEEEMLLILADDWVYLVNHSKEIYRLANSDEVTKTIDFDIGTIASTGSLLLAFQEGLFLLTKVGESNHPNCQFLD